LQRDRAALQADLAKGDRRFCGKNLRRNRIPSGRTLLLQPRREVAGGPVPAPPEG
jgi:hypothetical protein